MTITLIGFSADADDFSCFGEGLQDTSVNAANVQKNKMDIRPKTDIQPVLDCIKIFLMVRRHVLALIADMIACYNNLGKLSSESGPMCISDHIELFLAMEIVW